MDIVGSNMPLPSVSAEEPLFRSLLGDAAEYVDTEFCASLYFGTCESVAPKQRRAMFA